MDIYVCFSLFVPFGVCVYVQFHCYGYLRWVTSLMSRLDVLVAGHFIVKLFTFSRSYMAMAMPMSMSNVDLYSAITQSP